ncbi:hypothetical protein WDU94_011301 [Cyamophila willieti]
MHSIKYFLMVFEKFGVVNFHRFQSETMNRFQTVYVAFTKILTLCFAVSHSYNVITCATRYYPEFIQVTIENCLIWYFLNIVFYIQQNHHEMYSLYEHMDTFSKADRQVIRQCDRQAKHTCLSVFSIICIGILGVILEPLTAISQSELDIRRNVYRTKHPERRLPANIKIPLMDESESWAYEVLFLHQFYIIMIYGACTTLFISIIPVVMIHVKGQYEILCKYIKLIGQEHRNSLGNTIFYHNIEAHAYTIEKKSRTRTHNKLELAKERLRRRIIFKIYEADYLRQVIRFHHKLMAFQDKVNNIRSRLSETSDTVPS